MGWNEDDVLRAPKGSPRGGQFITFDATRKSQGQLEEEQAEWMNKHRAKELLNNGHVDATSHQVDKKLVEDGQRDDLRKTWWDRTQAQGEYNHPDGDYPKMADDNTPNMMPGRSTSGNRRTHRMRYETTEGQVMRMPSNTACHRFADELQSKGGVQTFDVPLSIDTPNGTRDGWARVTRAANDKHTWDVEPLGFNEDMNDEVRESVTAMLEARKGERNTYHGHRLKLRSDKRVTLDERTSWIRGMGYDPETKTMFVAMRGVVKSENNRPAVYGYRNVPPHVARAVMEAESTGKAYNKSIKNNFESDRASECGKCKMVYVSANGHNCKPEPQQSERAPVSYEQNERHKERAKAVAASVGDMQTPKAETFQKKSDTPSVTEWSRQCWKAAAKKEGGVALANKPRTVAPTVAPAFTMRGGIPEALDKYADRAHSPGAFRDADGNKVAYSNGDTGVMEFNGMGGEDAEKVFKALPKGNLDFRTHQNAPTTGMMLNAAAKSGGKIEVNGFAVPPHRADERIETNGVIYYSDTDDPRRAQWEVTNMGLQGRGINPPEVEQVTVPWNGRKAWRMTW